MAVSARRGLIVGVVLVNTVMVIYLVRCLVGKEQDGHERFAATN